MAIHIKAANKGKLHKDLGVKAGNKIPAKKLAAAKNSPDAAVRKRATFAENAKHWDHSHTSGVSHAKVKKGMNRAFPK